MFFILTTGKIVVLVTKESKHLGEKHVVYFGYVKREMPVRNLQRDVKQAQRRGLGWRKSWELSAYNQALLTSLG